MKKLTLWVFIFFFAVKANAQVTTGNGLLFGPNAPALNLNLGIGTNAPIHPLHIICGDYNYSGPPTPTSSLSGKYGNNGILIEKTAGATSAVLYLQYSTSPLGRRWGIASGGTASSGVGNFIISDLTAGRDRITIVPNGRVGINTATPGNRLEIKSEVPDPTSSGLRLTNMTALGPTTINPGKGVLSVDINGDVIYVPGGNNILADNGASLSTISPNTVVLGNNTIGPKPAKLISDREIPMNGYKIYFTSTNISDGLVLGPIASSGPAAKLQIFANNPGAPNAIYAEAKTPGLTNIAIEAKAFNNPGQLTYGVKSLAQDGRILYGVYGAAGYNPYPTSTFGIGYSFGVKGSAEYASDLAYHWGIVGHASGSDNFNMGGEFIASSINGNASTYGLFSSADGGYQAFGLYSAAGAASKRSYAVFGEINGLKNLAANPGSQNRAIYGKTIGRSLQGRVDNWAGYFDGDVNINGDGYYYGSIYITSDSIFKTKIDTITNALALINQLKPKTYFLDTTNAYKLNFSSEKQYGFIAQEVARVLPELVVQVNRSAVLDSAGNKLVPGVSHKAVNYNAFIALLMKGLQEQEYKINTLTSVTNKQDSIIQSIQNQLKALAAQINNCCITKQNNADNANTGNPQLNITLLDKDNIVLEQNVPNPFAQQTTIVYNVPLTAGKAQLIFYNALGSIIQTVEINARGKGKMNVFAGNLSAGIYHYTLVIDGRVVDSKKMVRE